MSNGVNVDNDAMKVAVSKAILDQMGEDGMKTIIQQAVESLLEKDGKEYAANGGKYAYNADRPTVIQRMFFEQAQNQLREIVRTTLYEDEEFKKKVDVLIKKTMTEIFEGDTLAGKLTEVVTEVIGKLTVERRY